MKTWLKENWIVLVLAMLALGAILWTGFRTTPNNKSVGEIPLVQQANEVAEQHPGAAITIEYEEREPPTTDNRSATATQGESKKSFGRGLSWFGLSANEAAAKDQGISANGGSIGAMHGYGILEQLWVWIRSVVWFGIVGILVLVAMLFIPATAAIAGTILRAIAAIFPVLGSVVERLVSGATAKTPLKQVITGGEKFKALLASSPLASNDKAAVLEMFRAAQNSAQTSSITRAQVDKLQ